MAQLRIKTKFGEVAIDFKDNKDLEQQLNKIDFKELENIVNKKIPQSSIVTTSVIEEFKDLYRLDSSGNVVLNKIPKKKVDALKLAGFFAEKGLSTNEMKTATGIPNPKAYMNKKDFIQNGEYFSLESKARIEVLEKIIPKLRKLKTN